MIKVILVDDHQIMLDGVQQLLEKEEDIAIVGTALDGNQAYKLIRQQEVDVAILDIEIPGISGVELTRLINEQYPDIKVVILTMHNQKDYVDRCISYGAKAYILKDKGYQELVQAVRNVYQGKTSISQEIVEVLVDAFKDKKERDEKPGIQLTKREKEVLSMIAEGKSKHEISRALFISPATVDTHRKNIMEKTGVGSSRELIVYALKNKELYS